MEKYKRRINLLMEKNTKKISDVSVNLVPTKTRETNFKQQLITKQHEFKDLSKILIFKINDLIKISEVENALSTIYINDVETWNPSEINTNKAVVIFKNLNIIISAIQEKTGVNIVIDHKQTKRNKIIFITEYFNFNKCFKSLCHQYEILNIDSSQALLELNHGIKEQQQKIVRNMNDCIKVFEKGNIGPENIKEYLKSSIQGAFSDIGIFPDKMLQFIFVWKRIYQNISPLDLKLNQIYIDYFNGNFSVKQEIENFCRRFPNISEKEKNCCIRLYFMGVLKTSKELFNEKRKEKTK